MNADNNYQRLLGNRLRSIRAQQELTLQDVEDRSEGRWKAVVIGSYERGDRAVSIAKLSELARFYGVPLTDLLPQTITHPDQDDRRPESTVVLDLTRLEESGDTAPELEALKRYAHRIQVQRGDYNGRVLTLRSTDLHALAAVVGTEDEELLTTLEDRQIARAKR